VAGGDIRSTSLRVASGVAMREAGCLAALLYSCGPNGSLMWVSSVARTTFIPNNWCSIWDTIHYSSDLVCTAGATVPICSTHASILA
jgi:hypothetical protein